MTFEEGGGRGLQPCIIVRAGAILSFLPSSLSVTQALQFMLQVDDDEEWLTHDNTEDDDDATRSACNILETVMSQQRETVCPFSRHRN